MTSAINSTTTTTHLALYTGPMGPISVELTCADLDEACAWVREHGGYAYNDAEDALGLPALCDDRDEIDAALVRGGWRTVASCDEGEWSIHRRAAVALDAGSEITDDQIRALRTEAASAGDDEQVRLCALALEGDAEARAACERAIRDARAQVEA